MDRYLDFMDDKNLPSRGMDLLGVFASTNMNNKTGQIVGT